MLQAARAMLAAPQKGVKRMPEVNVWAIVVAALSSFALGGLWYSPVLFGGLWNRANGSTPQQRHPARVFGLSFVFALIAAFAFAVWLGPAPPLPMALRHGLIVGACFVMASFGINYQFAGRSTVLLLIDGGYHVMQFLLFGLVLGLWH
jgi:hypothetical protein